MSEAWSEVDGLFEAALDLDEAGRARLLAGCPDPAIRREVEALLAADAAPAHLIDRPAAELTDVFGATAVPPEPVPLPGRIGPYRPLSELGRGGMAVVYDAERVDGHFEQHVALKLMHAGADRERIVQRFERERQILASLEHPSIARLLDGGLAADGRPYFAMERVDGLPIDRHCNERHLDIEARLRLFCEVVRAVEFAHQRLILHRDLKPSNILVTGEGHVKLLDFGIATVFEPEAGAQRTRTVGGFMTPEYASPEQIRGETMTTASDIYQLGLLLYELLTGRRPYEFSGSSPSEAERVVCETMPDKPSRLFSTGSVDSDRRDRWTREAAALARGSQPARLGRRLRGDLDTIVLMCLRKEPDRRYVSAAELAADIGRHLAGLPVVAHPDTVGYRLRKFVARNRAALVVALVVASFAGYHLRVVYNQNRRVAAERDRAREEAAKSSAIRDFLVDLFEGARPYEIRGEDTTVREVLDLGAPRIAEAFAAQPAVRAELLATTGDIYRSLGLYTQAEAYLEPALAAANELSSEPLARAEYQVRLAKLRDDQGDLTASEALLREALASRERALGPEDPRVASVLDGLGDNLVKQRKLDEARVVLDRALAIRIAALGEEHGDVATSLTSLAELDLTANDLPAAEARLRQALANQRRNLPPGHPDITSTLASLSRTLKQQDRLDEAEALQREALANQRRYLGDDHPYTAVALSNLAQVLHVKGDLEAAAETFQLALELRRKSLPPRHPMIASNLNDLALVRRDQGDLNEAERQFREALRTYADDHPWRSVTEFNLASVLRPLGRYEEAAAMMREILAADRARYGDQHGAVAVDCWELGLNLAALGRPGEAETLLLEARRIYVGILPPGHPLLFRLDAYHGNLLVDQGRLDEAEPLLTGALAALGERYGDESPHTARAQLGLGLLYLERGDPARAEPFLRAAEKTLSPRGGHDAATIREAVARL